MLEHPFVNVFNICILAITLILVASDQTYCGIFDAASSEGADGYFRIILSDDNAAYRMELDLSEFDTSACTEDSSLTYAVFSYWNSSTLNGAGDTFCSESNTGLHYDPTFACSTYSQGRSTDCAELGRTVADGYKYNCTTAVYSAGDFDQCEIGDLSSKFGTIGASTTRDDTYAYGADYSLPLTYDYWKLFEADYQKATTDSGMWSSIGIGCNGGSTRLLCAKLVATDGVDCTSYEDDDFFDNDDQIDWSHLDPYDIFFLVVGLALFAVTVAFIGTVSVHYFMTQTPRHAQYMNRQTDAPLKEGEGEHLMSEGTTI
jgi:hypothetical protein